MENSFCKKIIFKSAFDSFEFDDGFLSKVDAEVKKNGKDLGSRKDKDEEAKNYFNSSINFDDLDDSDFIHSNIKADAEISSKAPLHLDIKPKKVEERLKKKLIGCLSPIQGTLSLNEQNRSFSSTPLRKDLKEVGNAKKTDYNYIDADLFEDWDNEDFNVEQAKQDECELITLSQAFQMIQKAECEECHLNKSIDLLTGEVVQSGDVHSDRKDKPAAAQKLNFEGDVDPPAGDPDLGDIFLSSDEDFNAFPQVGCVEANAEKGATKHNSTVLSDGSDDLGTKRAKKFKRIIESDTTEDSPSPKFRRKFKKKKSNDSQGKQYLHVEAEVSDVVEISSDEIDHRADEYEKSFLDEDSYFTENCSAGMTAKYLESIKTVGGRINGFKIPKAKPYIPDNVFSQMPEEPNTDYELDSFCVDEVEEEMKTDLSDLEIAEEILEINRKKRKQKRGRKQLKRIK